MEIFQLDTNESFSIPFFSIQPLIENAVEHGLLQKIDGESISLICKKKTNLVIIKIEDDGIGISKDSLKKIKKRLIHQNQLIDHIGIYNCYHRLKLFFEENLEFQMTSTEGKGTCINISISNINMRKSSYHSPA
jgi:hypothetical protein